MIGTSYASHALARPAPQWNRPERIAPEPPRSDCEWTCDSVCKINMNDGWCIKPIGHAGPHECKKGHTWWGAMCMHARAAGSLVPGPAGYAAALAA